MAQIKVNLFTLTMEPVGEYFAPTPPRKGEDLVWEDVLYHVETVTWEGLDSSEPAVQVRLER